MLCISYSTNIYVFFIVRIIFQIYSNSKRIWLEQSYFRIMPPPLIFWTSSGINYEILLSQPHLTRNSSKLKSRSPNSYILWHRITHVSPNPKTKMILVVLDILGIPISTYSTLTLGFPWLRGRTLASGTNMAAKKLKLCLLLSLL